MRRPLEVNGDWADTVTLGYVMADIESDGRHFYARENGQAMGLYFLSDAAAEELFDLGGELFRVIPDEDEEEYEEEDDEE